MATETLRPNGDGVVACSYVGSSTHYQNVDEATPSDADYNYVSDTTPYQDTLNLADSVIGAGAITNVSLRTRLWTGGAGFDTEYVIPKLVVGSVNYNGATRGSGTSVAEFTDDWASNPAGGAWTWAAINALQVGYTNCGGNDGKGLLSDGAVSQQYIIVTYTPLTRSQGCTIG